MKSEAEIYKAIGNRLKELRIQKGYNSYETFAIDHDLGRMQYWRLEKGESNLTMRSLIKVLAVHDMTLKEFFSEGF